MRLLLLPLLLCACMHTPRADTTVRGEGGDDERPSERVATGAVGGSVAGGSAGDRPLDGAQIGGVFD